ncbi:MAG: DUF3152 domain-containing protein [Nitriliruptoraceae bacterium]
MTGRTGQRVTIGLLAALVVFLGSVALVRTSDTGARDLAIASTGELGPAAGEARRPMTRWWFTPWPIEPGDGGPFLLGPEGPAAVEVPPDDPAGSRERSEMAAPFADEADVRVEASDIVALRTAEGFDVAAGDAEFGSGSTLRYTVEVEPAVGEDLLAFTAAVEEALGDPRSWAGERRFVRVDDPAQASVRVVLATPATVDRLCGEVGLQTVGRYSCWTGTFAALNAWRWAEGATAFEDITTYRRYLVNHEVGHALGYGHVECPQPDALAPVMMQQSIGTNGCVANGWPYP